MILSMSSQASLFLTTVIIGVCLGFIYDWIRVFRNIIKHANIIIQIEDALYWIAISLAVFFIMLNKNYGEIRAFSIFGSFLGMIVYFFTISHIFMSVSMAIINFIKKVIIVTIRIIITPFRIILKILSYPAKYIKGKLNKMCSYEKKILKKYYLYAKIKRRKTINNIRVIFKKI